MIKYSARGVSEQFRTPKELLTIDNITLKPIDGGKVFVVSHWGPNDTRVSVGWNYNSTTGGVVTDERSYTSWEDLEGDSSFVVTQCVHGWSLETDSMIDEYIPCDSKFMYSIYQGEYSGVAGLASVDRILISDSKPDYARVVGKNGVIGIIGDRYISSHGFVYVGFTLEDLEYGFNMYASLEESKIDWDELVTLQVFKQETEQIRECYYDASTDKYYLDSWKTRTEISQDGWRFTNGYATLYDGTQAEQILQDTDPID